MKNPKFNKKRQGLTGTFATLAITQDAGKRADTGSAIPSDEQVAQAKDWVDFNKK